MFRCLLGTVTCRAGVMSRDPEGAGVWVGVRGSGSSVGDSGSGAGVGVVSRDLAGDGVGVVSRDLDDGDFEPLASLFFMCAAAR